MSEFTEIVKQANRMCLFYKDCNVCPIHVEVMNREGEYKYECGLNQLFTTNIELLEAKILRWAKEHPKDIYPSWKDAWIEAFPDADVNNICPKNFFGVSLPYCSSKSGSCEQCIKHPMEEKIAKRLCINPRSNDNRRYNFSTKTWEEEDIIL